jgi:hypothetical protein
MVLNMITVTVEAKNDFHKFETVKVDVLTSIANNTPPIGAPNAHVVPTAIAEVRN